MLECVNVNHEFGSLELMRKLKMFRASALCPCPYKPRGWRPPLGIAVTPFGFPTIDRAEWPVETPSK